MYINNLNEFSHENDIEFLFRLSSIRHFFITVAVESRPTSSSCRFYGDLVVDAGGGGGGTGTHFSSSSSSSSLSSGFLANIVTEEHGFGSARCPWLVTAPHGQRINITLFDFGLAGRHDGAVGATAANANSATSDAASGMASGGSMCHVYAKVTETGSPSASASEITICGSRSRQRSVYISETNRLEIVITSFKMDDEPVYFLLKYEGKKLFNCALHKLL